ncbi:toll/interleukin-1 receptor domain-containing protein [Streptomyces sp. CA-251387]|uniref:toll/interleukin-1 receptor domain-containing protein n=1 Tax=Streptomyces sp. CA-251387 TaxID=3240064 RepID=UPI003D902530
MDTDDSKRPARPDHSWQTSMVDALLDSPTAADRQARALLIELIGDLLGRRVSLREQSTAHLQLLELVRFCVHSEGGLPALTSAVHLLEGSSRAAETVARLAAEWESPEERGAGGPAVQERPGDHRSTSPSDPVRPPPEGSGDRKDFFVSYTSADRAWAAWIAWQLEEAGYRVLVQEWDFVPGSNWQFVMEKGVTECERIIAVLSPAYLRSVYGRQESLAAQGEDPTGVARRLVPVRVAPFTPRGLLGGVVYIDLVALSPEEARTRLLDGIGGARSGRAKPLAPPRFPG